MSLASILSGDINLTKLDIEQLKEGKDNGKNEKRGNTTSIIYPLVGGGVPVNQTPKFIGHMYIDTVDRKVFVAMGLKTTDWMLLQEWV